MSIKSFTTCHDRIHKRLKRKYNVCYNFPHYYDRPNILTLWNLRSFSPGANNTTKTLRLLINMAKKHKVKVRLCAASRYYGPVPSNLDTFKESEYYYWRALLMYQRVGFKPVNKESFLNDSIHLYAIDLIAG